MGGVSVGVDTILVPLSMFVTIGYHAYLWHTFTHKPPSLTTIGIHSLRRKLWLTDMEQGDDKKGMLAVQSLRNSLMAAILSATVSILITMLLGAVANNSYKAGHLHLHLLMKSPLFGSQSGGILVLKFGSITLSLLLSFLCSSVGVGCLIDANFLINAYSPSSSSSSSSSSGDDDDDDEDDQCSWWSPSLGYSRTVMERGFTMAVVGNRVLCISFPLLLWMLGPVPMALSSVALVWGLYGLDFAT